MADLSELVDRFCPSTLGWGIGCDPVRVLRFHRLELLELLVKFNIADDRVIEHMVAVVVEVNLGF